jgi:hypothetical protein
MKSSLARRALFVAIPPVMLTCIACGERAESVYPTLADAKRDGAIARGWLPNVLPDGSRNIREIHSIDDPRSWSTFEFSPEDAVGLREALSESGSAGLPVAVPSPGVQWWPDVLEGKLSPPAIERSGLTLYMSGSGLFAIDWKSRRGFVYRDGQ